MHNKAIANNKKVNGFTAAQLQDQIIEFEKYSKE